MMINPANEKKIEKNSKQWIPILSGSKEITILVCSLEIITKIGKNSPILFLSLASLNVLLAANDFLSNSIEFGIMNSLMAANGFIFVVQMQHNDRFQPLTLNPIKPDFESFLEMRNK